MQDARAVEDVANIVGGEAEWPIGSGTGSSAGSTVTGSRKTSSSRS